MPSSQGRSLAQRRSRWSLIIFSRKAIAEKLPHLVEELNDLESVDKKIGTLSAKQVYYMAKVRETTKQLRTLSQKGDRIRGRIGASLRMVTERRWVPGTRPDSPRLGNLGDSLLGVPSGRRALRADSPSCGATQGDLLKARLSWPIHSSL